MKHSKHLSLLFVFGMCLYGCSQNNGDSSAGNGDSQVLAYYAQYKENGGTLSYEKWLDELKNGNLGIETQVFHTVTFDSQNGSNVPSQQVKHGEKITKPTDPTKEGYSFEGWTYDEQEWIFSIYVVTEDITLTANWEELPPEPPQITELTIRNLYFNSYSGDDIYTDFIEDKFNVEIHPSSYDYSVWSQQAVSQVYGNCLPDAFHFDVEPYNFGHTYKTWAEADILKALPQDLSKWPNINNLINNSSSMDYFKVNEKLYGIPIAYNKDDMNKQFTNYTYLYRRDWLKILDASKVHEDDTYTFNEFLEIIDLFGTKEDVIYGNSAAIGDVSWGFPSLTNFFKDSPHCYSVDANGVVSNAFTTEGYEQGLIETAKLISTPGTNLYYDQASHTNDTQAYNAFKGGHLGIYYENLSLSNYSMLRKDISNTVPGISESQLNDMTAIMKVKGPDGKYHLEGCENWFSMTFFNHDISNEKQEKILDILDYLLSEEGTMLAIYGIENEDYILDENNEPVLVEEKWPKRIESDGEYASKINGAKYLRNMITLNNDTAEFDPFTNQKSYEIIAGWQNDMKTAQTAGNLVSFQEPSNVKWLSTPLKDANTASLIKEGNDNVLRYCYHASGFSTIDDYKASFNTAKWNNTFAEINHVLGF